MSDTRYILKLSKKKNYNYAIVRQEIHDSGHIGFEEEINWTDSFEEGQEKVDAWNSTLE